MEIRPTTIDNRTGRITPFAHVQTELKAIKEDIEALENAAVSLPVDLMDILEGMWKILEELDRRTERFE